MMPVIMMEHNLCRTEEHWPRTHKGSGQQVGSCRMFVAMITGDVIILQEVQPTQCINICHN